jgi:Holliday junction DNA helicase RuvB
VVTRAARLLGIGIDVRRRRRDRPPRARHAAHRRAAAAPGARLRHVAGAAEVDARIADSALTRLEVDALGLDAMDRRYLMMIADIYKGGPRWASRRWPPASSEPRDTIEE